LTSASEGILYGSTFLVRAWTHAIRVSFLNRWRTACRTKRVSTIVAVSGHPPHDAERHRTPTLEQPLDPEQKLDSAREDFPKGTA
jgi:hypothetical protein